MSLVGERYASYEMREIWSRKKKIIMERKLWIAVMKIQAEFGVEISKATISDYERVLLDIKLGSIDSRELELGHDVKARIEEFNALAGHEQIHLGMTSRDLTENVELIQIKLAIELIAMKARVLLLKLADKSETLANTLIVARTHNVPAQLTTLGKKFANWAEELEIAELNLENLLFRIPIRGIHGAVGTNLDLKELIGRNVEKFNEILIKELGFERVLNAPAQIYPRSIDFEVVASLFQLVASPNSMATNIRLMSGLEIASEGLPKGKTGSSAMPHKINPRLSERLNSLATILKGHLTMIADISGTQWNEGDVSCSAVRRVALPDAFYVTDAILEIAIYLLDQIEFNDDELKREIEVHTQEVCSSSVLMLAVKQGVGRELAHNAIKEHAIASKSGADFFELVLGDPSLAIGKGDIDKLKGDLKLLAGDAPAQARMVAFIIKERLAKKIDLANFHPSTLR
jgi:adenylosuccinate lyase